MKNEADNVENLRKLKHDIKNQLSNINLAVEALQYETPGQSEDYTFCINTILTSTLTIDRLLNQLD